MDPLSRVSGGAQGAGDTRAAVNRSNDLGRDEFLTLMVAQLKNQNPLQPQQGTEFVAQMAQFSALDQLVGIKDTLRVMARLMITPPPSTGPAPTGHDTPFGRTPSA